MKKTIYGALVATSLMAFAGIAQAQSLPPNGDLDRDGIANQYDRDRDGDSIANARDDFPNDPRRS